eukprot:TRINITY_DN2023_c0_g3_i4.p1 TRINITY_DN2023_c0_g3~~TRINITY_DN2023_c0_g3_i4.p1  ORF type:complete len:564 (-),score=105.63 TRINITY_DN2023_c0_g3_i4:243-1934(-)
MKTLPKDMENLSLCDSELKRSSTKSNGKDDTTLSSSSSSLFPPIKTIFKRRQSSITNLPTSQELRQYEEILLCDYTPPSPLLSKNEDEENEEDIVLRALPLMSLSKSMNLSICDKPRFDSLYRTEERIKNLFKRRKERFTQRLSLVQKMLAEQKESQAVYQGATPPDNEVERLAALQKMNILDTDFDENFDRLTRLAVTLFKVKIAVISLVDEHRQWFKSAQGLATRYTCRNNSFCAFAIKQDKVFVSLDATKDDRFKNNPVVNNAPHVRFYAGAPLITSDGFRLGTLCLVDNEPRQEFSEADQNMLRNLADIVFREMELFRQNQTSIKEGERHRIVSELCQQALQLESMKNLYAINMIRMAEVLDVDFVHILEFTEDQKVSIMQAGFGWRPFVKIGQEINMSSVIDSLMKKYKTAQSFDETVIEIENADIKSSSQISFPSFLANHLIKSGICVLLSYNEKPFGLIGAYDTHPHAWHEEDKIFLMNCAKSLSVLIERTQHSIEVANERKRTDNLLYHVLPVPISDRLKAKKNLLSLMHMHQLLFYLLTLLTLLCYQHKQGRKN